MPTHEITVDLDSANGPKVVYPRGTDAEDVDLAAPVGWEVDWDAPAADCGPGAVARPLRRAL
jgi:hypothetical protein